MTDLRQYADTSQPAPDTIHYDMQPYGQLVLGQLRWGQYNGFPTLEGVVVEGSATSRLFQYTSTRSVVGQRRTIHGIKQHEVDAGQVIRIAM
jgi:hypothetical protein